MLFVNKAAFRSAGLGSIIANPATLFPGKGANSVPLSASEVQQIAEPGSQYGGSVIGTTPTAAAPSASSENSPAAAFAANTAAALAQFQSQINSESSGADAYFPGMIESAVAARNLPTPDQTNASTTCSGTSSSGINIGVATASTTTAVGGAIAAAESLPLVGTIIATIGGLISGIFGADHAKAVQAQNNAICGAVPAAQQAYATIDQGLAAGTVSPSQAASYYTQLQSQFTAAMKTGTSYKTGDALWSFDITNQAIVVARNLDLQAGVLTGGAQAPWANPSSASSVASSVASALGLGGSVSIGGISIPTEDLLIGAAIALGALLLL